MSQLKELRSRISEFFRVQPNRQPVGLDLLAQEFDDADLKKLIPEELADAAAKKAEEEKHTVPQTKAERKDYGRKAVLTSTVEELAKEGAIQRKKMDAGGMGFAWTGEYKPDQPEGQTAKVTKLPIDQIRIDPKIQQRADGINDKTVDEYALVADRLPPARVFKFKDDDGQTKYILSRGFHRVAAWKKAGWDTIPVEVFEGDREAALLDAAGDNATHGRRRTVADIARAVDTLLSTRFYRGASVAMIASAVGISWAFADKLVKKVHAAEEAERRAKNEPEPIKPVTRKGKDGKTYSAESKKKKASKEAPPAVKAPKDPDHKKAPSEVKDKTGQAVSNEIAPAFMDTRFSDAIGSMRELLKYMADVRAEYAVSTLGVESRKALFAEIEFKLESLALSLPFAGIPENAAVETQIARRKWMTEAELKAWVKGGRKRKEGKGEPSANGEASHAESPAEPAAA